ncbi:MAG TPA: DNA polymerase III subunit gamma/tau [Steroidobacteraceae bacterium]|nr:DNA polymerase III subunit gamma/tau [Steroidobacteraceae bacterium]
MAYTALARTWRPKKFAELVGQEHVRRALTNALETGRVHHAFLFTGTRGVGKTTIARIFAKCLNCETGVTATPCGVCGACREIDSGRFVDLVEVDAASNTKVDDTRELLDNVQYAPARGRYKVYLIDEVHMLSTHSFNALLKTLEEPPPHVKFLLATTDPQKLPVTVLSRCLQFNLKRLPVSLIAERMREILEKEGVPFEAAGLRLVAQAADGSMRDGLSLLDQLIAFGGGKAGEEEARAMLGTIARDHVVRLAELLGAMDVPELLSCARSLEEFAPDYAQVLDELAALFVRIAMKQAVSDFEGDELYDPEVLTRLAKAIAPEDVQLFYQTAITGRRDLGLAPDPRAGFEMTLLRMIAFRPLGEAEQLRGGPSAGGGGAGGSGSGGGAAAARAAAAAAAAGAGRGGGGRTSAAAGSGGGLGADASAGAGEGSGGGPAGTGGGVLGSGRPFGGLDAGDSAAGASVTPPMSGAGGSPMSGAAAARAAGAAAAAGRGGASVGGGAKGGGAAGSVASMRAAQAGSAPSSTSSGFGDGYGSGDQIAGGAPDRSSSRVSGGVPGGSVPGVAGAASGGPASGGIHGSAAVGGTTQVRGAVGAGAAAYDMTSGGGAAARGASGPTGRAGAGTSGASTPSLTTTDIGEPWSTLITRLELGGAARQLASNCQVMSRQGSVLRLALDARNKHMRTPAQEDKLAQALSRHFGQPIRLEFETAASGIETPALAEQRASMEDLDAARRAFESDPGVQGLRERFGATLLPDTIRPVK